MKDGEAKIVLNNIAKKTVIITVSARKEYAFVITASLENIVKALYAKIIVIIKESATEYIIFFILG